MPNEQDIMRVTIHSQYLTNDESSSTSAARLLKKAMETIESYERRGWEAQVINQSEAGATITFYRSQAAETRV